MEDSICYLPNKTWANIIRGDIARRRSKLGTASIVLTILSWVTFVTPILLHMLRTDNTLVGVDWDEIVLLLIIAGSMLALTLRSSITSQRRIGDHIQA